MTEPKLDVGRSRNVAQHAPVDRYRGILLAQADGDRRGERTVVEIVRVDGDQTPNLLARLEVFVTPHQGLGVVEARRVVIGLHCDYAGQQQFGVVQDVPRHADAGQQAHAFRMVAVPKQKGADDLLGRSKVAVGKEARRGQDLGRQRLQHRDMGRCGRRVRLVPRDSVDAFQHPPAHRQRRIDVDRAKQGVDRGRGVLARDVAQAAFLVLPAETRVALFEAIQHLQGFGYAPQMAQARRRDEVKVAVYRVGGE